MPISKRTTVSEKKRDFERGSKKGMYPRIADYLQAAYDSKDIDRQLFKAREIGKFKGATARLFSAKALIEIAQKHLDQLGSEQAMILSESMEAAQRAIRLDQLGLVTIEAEKLQHEIPMRLELSENRLPSKEMSGRYLERRVGKITEMFSVWEKFKTANNGDRGHMKGYMSEEATGILLARWVSRSAIDGFIPISSTLSEDFGQITHGSYRTGWDISVFTNYPDDLSLTHCLQVKSGFDPEKTYTPENEALSLVHVSELRHDPRSRRSVAPQFILSEILNEQNDDRHASRRLDTRTDILLDMFSN